jgi:hypothetical protein
MNRPKKYPLYKTAHYAYLVASAVVLATAAIAVFRIIWDDPGARHNDENALTGEEVARSLDALGGNGAR